MGKLYCLIILLFLGSGSFSQSIKKDTSTQFMLVDAKALNPTAKPLYVVDGIIFKHSIKKINPENIESVSVIKPPASTNIYGKLGSNGAIIIITKKRGEVGNRKINDTIAKKYSGLRDIGSRFPDHPLYVIDEKPVDDSLVTKTMAKINPKDIFEITILRDARAEALYGIRGALDVILIKTEYGAIREYQKMFSYFSEKYKQYLEINKNNDDDVGYIADGIFITEKDPGDKVSRLYKISKMDIKSVDLIDNTFQNGNKEKKIVVITTKK